MMLKIDILLDKKKYTFEEAMKALKKGDIIESCYSGKKYVMSPKGNEHVYYFDTEYKNLYPYEGELPNYGTLSVEEENNDEDKNI